MIFTPQRRFFSRRFSSTFWRRSAELLAAPQLSVLEPSNAPALAHPAATPQKYRLSVDGSPQGSHEDRHESNPENNPENSVVSLRQLSKSYSGGQYPAVAKLSLEVRRGEMLALLGPSGCGKTTLLRMIAGFEIPDEGSIVIDGQQVVDEQHWLKPEQRNVGFVFQDYALFPHLDVMQNVLFGLSHLPKKQRQQRAESILDIVGLRIFSHRYPHQLSGGQQQRVALARALAPAPSVVLLDEPFSNLDAALRGSTRAEVRRILHETGTTGILVTHDQEEAMTFADRLAVMRMGQLEQLGSPEAVYHSPRTAFVASFLGKTNLLRGQAERDTAHTTLGTLPLSRRVEGSVLLSLRPEDLRFSPDQGVAVEVISREFKGHDLTYTCQLQRSDDKNKHSFIVQTGPECAVRVGDVTRLQSTGLAVPLESSTAQSQHTE